MDTLRLSKAFTLIEPGPVVLVTTSDGDRDNVMTITWTMVLDFLAAFAITTGPWNHSYAALRRSRECVISVPTVDMIDVAAGWERVPGKTPTNSRSSVSPAPRPGMSGERLDRKALMQARLPGGI